jgi:hypothetical protein
VKPTARRYALPVRNNPATRRRGDAATSVSAGALAAEWVGPHAVDLRADSDVSAPEPKSMIERDAVDDPSAGNIPTHAYRPRNDD